MTRPAAGPEPRADPAPPPGAEPLLPEGCWGDPAAGFLEVARPLVLAARARLAAGLAAIVEGAPGAPSGRPLFDPATAERLLTEALPERLLPLLARTLVLELHVRKVQCLLAGETSEARFQSFGGWLREPESAEALWGEYPVLADRVQAELDRWVDVWLEHLSRLAADWPAIVAALFDGRDPGPLTALQGGAGDLHRGGRSVVIAGFESGAKLVYKPRPLAVDVHFGELLAWLAGRSDEPPLTTPRVLDRGAYGWVEHVAAAPCALAEEVARWHRRLGGLLALLYAVEATDCHYENLIAAGDQPVLVDLEALFHPRVPRPEPAKPDERLSARLVGRSVLRIGLLPFRVGETDDFAGVDVSGVAAVAGQPTPHPMLRFVDVGTDEMRVVRERLTMEGGRNRPTLDGREVEAVEHVDEMAAGFAAVYRLLVRHRDELLAPGGPIDRFTADFVRAVLRPTQVYGLLLVESLHPDLLRDTGERARFFDRLRVGVEDQPALARAMPAEHRDLMDGDVPYFASLPGSLDLWSSRGERIEGFFDETALAAVRHRLESMGEEDLHWQTWLLRLSLGTQALNRDALDWPGYAPVDPGAPLPEPELRSRLIEGARAVGGWLERMALTDGRHATWISLEYRSRRWSMVPAPEDLYAGLPGIALFLGFLGELAGDERATGLARAAVASLAARLPAEEGSGPVNIGLFQGWGGIAWALAQLGALWRDPGLLEQAGRAAERIAALLDRDEDLDVVGGAAGAIAGLLAVGSQPALEVAAACGERLLATARPYGAGLAWLTRVASDTPQTGFSHGAAGIGLALLRLGTATGDARFTDAGRAAFAWEREAFWPELERLLDAGGDIPLPLESTVAMAWCYGAPGVGLARLAALPHLPVADRPAAAAELERSVGLTLERGFGRNHCLCHGDLGNLDLLLAADLAAAGELSPPARQRAQEVLASIERDGWICGTRGAVESPALMNGLAGIGYGLLRLAAPARVPSVLALEPPPTGVSS